MPLNLAPLPLPADPQAVSQARDWVTRVLDKLGREDLVDAAQLGVSELVTNAILHAEPPILVQVRGTRDHPRVEVRDRSQGRPEVNVEMAEDDHLLSTIGRGLGLVALSSSAWGSEVSPDGKTVWFEPTAEPRLDGELSGDVFDLEEAVERRLAEAGRPEDLFTVRLLDMPVQVFAYFRRRLDELRRELRLLSLDHGDAYPVATELTDVFLQVEQERRQADGVERLDDAIASGVDRADLEYQVPDTAPATMARLGALLERADAFCHDQRLLVLAASPQQVELQRWYLGEFIRQAAGEPPTPWTGAFAVETVARAG